MSSLVVTNQMSTGNPVPPKIVVISSSLDNSPSSSTSLFNSQMPPRAPQPVEGAPLFRQKNKQRRKTNSR